MRIGLSVNPERDYPERISELPDWCEFVELAIGEGHKSLEQLDTEGIKSELEMKNLDLIVHLPFHQPLASTVGEYNRAKIKYNKMLLDRAAELGTEKAVAHCNLRWNQDKKEVREELENQISKLARLGEERGIEICFENIFVEQQKPADLAVFGDIMVDSQVSMCFDIGHAVAEVGHEETLIFLEEHRDIISHLHLQDTRNREDSHLALGDGEIDFEAVGRLIKDFDGTACLEIFTEDEKILELSKNKLLEHFE